MGSYHIEDIPMMPPAPMFPTSLEGWGGSYNGMEYDEEYIKKQFPAPIEGWVGYYEELDTLKEIADKMFPAPIEASVVSYYL